MPTMSYPQPTQGLEILKQHGRDLSNRLKRLATHKLLSAPNAVHDVCQTPLGDKPLKVSSNVGQLCQRNSRLPLSAISRNSDRLAALNRSGSQYSRRPHTAQGSSACP